MPAPAVVWRPDAELLRTGNVARLMSGLEDPATPDAIAASVT